MALFDKLKDTLNTAKEKTADALKNAKENLGQYKEESAELKAPVEGAIIRYEVVYGGGLPQYPKAKSGAIGLNITIDAFVLKKTIGTKDWFEDFEIPYNSVQKFEITKRQAGNWEMAFSNDAASAKATEVENVLAITYIDANGTELLLRLEMLTGFTIYNQAKTCLELLDVLRQNNILNRLNKATSTQVGALSNADELKKFKDLLDSGIITQEEFDAKKKDLLSL